MQFSSEDYYKAAVERMKQAEAVYQDGQSFALAMYCGGLAVECLLRAFRWSRDRTFEGRHNLDELLKASGLLATNDEHLRHKKKVLDGEIRDDSVKLRAAMNRVIILWHNNLRFASEARLKRFLREINCLRGIKGDPCKKNAFDLIEAAGTIIAQGIVLWESKRRS
jgi:hypothetical protein